MQAEIYPDLSADRAPAQLPSLPLHTPAADLRPVGIPPLQFVCLPQLVFPPGGPVPLLGANPERSSPRTYWSMGDKVVRHRT